MTILSAFHAWLPSNIEGGFTASAYNSLPWGSSSAISYNYGSDFDVSTGLWTPPAGFVLLSCQIRCYNGLELNQVITAKLSKDAGATHHKSRTGTGTKGNYEGTASRDSIYICHLPGVQNTADGTEAFRLELYTTDADIRVDAIAAHTFWSGVCFEAPSGLV